MKILNVKSKKVNFIMTVTVLVIFLFQQSDYYCQHWPKYLRFFKPYNAERIKRGIMILPESWRMINTVDEETKGWWAPNGDSLQKSGRAYRSMKTICVKDHKINEEIDLVVLPDSSKQIHMWLELTYHYDSSKWSCIYVNMINPVNNKGGTIISKLQADSILSSWCILSK